MSIEILILRGCKQAITLTIGLLPVGKNLFILYFAHLPLIGFDAARGKLVRLSNPGWPKAARLVSGHACPDTNRKNKNLPDKENVSGMCPV